MRSIDNSFYHSTEWERCRADYLKSVNGMCERCKAKGIYEPARVVHHKIYLTEENYREPSVSLNFKNLEALCQDCHNREHHRNDKRYEIGPGGELIY